MRCSWSSCVRWGGIGQRGERTEAVSLGTIPEYYDPAPAAAVGDDTVVLLPGYTGGTGVASHLDVARVRQDGAAIYPRYVLARTGLVDSISSYALASRGADLIAAWLIADSTQGDSSRVYPSAIGLARVIP